MKKTVLLIVSMIFMTALFAQELVPNLYVLFVSDKGASMDAGINPSLFLSDKSVERRLKQQIAFDQSDIPVNEQYVSEISKTGARILARSRWFNTIVIEATNEIVNEISSLPFISKVQRINNGNKQVSVSVKPFFEVEKVNPWIDGITKKVNTDVYNYGSAYNQINQLNGQYLHNNGFSGQGMTIAVIDAGFNSVDIMPCFDSLRANNQIKGTRDFAVPGNNVYGTSMHTHGTSVLSCMGAYVSGQMVGTAPKADYWLLRSEVGESESIIEEYYWVSAAEFADSIGADLINSSLGYTTFDDPLTNHTYADMDGNTTFITNGADKAAEKGILVVNSAGNSGNIYDPWKYIGAPADGDSVFSIGAIKSDGTRSEFSSLGPTYDRRIKPTVAAQGSGAAIYYPTGFGQGSGTSFSSPIICGMTACLWQALPDFNNMQIIEAIKATASQANQPDSLLGWGIPNYQSAYNSLSVYNQAVEKTLRIYPNPVVDKLTIDFAKLIHGKYKIDIVDLQGKVVYTKQGDEDFMRTLQISNIGYLTKGMYFVKVSNSSLNFSGKIIKL
jgi:hypothetical protein